MSRRGVVAACRPPSLIGGSFDRSISGIGRRDGKSQGRSASSPAVICKQRSATNVALSLALCLLWLVSRARTKCLNLAAAGASVAAVP